MRRFAWVTLLAVLAGAATAQTRAQNGRARLQEAYRNWRLVDPNLEADAGSSQATMGVRADRVAAEAAKYFAERKSYYEALSNEMHEAAKNMAGTPAALDFPAAPAAINVESRLSALAANLAAIPKNADAGLQELKRALEREQAALTAWKALPAGAKLEAQQNAGQTREHYAELAAKVAQESAESDALAAAWASYYRVLAAGAREGTNISSAKPADPTAPQRERLSAAIASAPKPEVPKADAQKMDAPNTVTLNVPPPLATLAPSTRVVPANDHADHLDTAAAPSGAIRSTSPVNAPVTRYAGAWVYPTVNEHYHGAHPESVDLVIQDQNGQMSGSFRTKFRLPAGSNLNPVVEFTFAGDYQAARMQTFRYVTPDGVKGTLELIPATTFNLLEISFVDEGDPRPGRITRGNFFLIRK